MRAHRRVDGALRQRFAYAARAQRCLVEGGIICHHRDDEIAVFADVRNICGDLCAGFRQICRLSGAAVIDEQVVAAAKDAGGHPLSHPAQTDKSDFHEASESVSQQSYFQAGNAPC